MYDIVVIGAGPAGLTAALYARRASKTVMVLEKGAFGGQITFSPKVENIPGFASLTGNEFAEKLVDQALGQGAEVDLCEVTEIKDNGDTKIVVTDSGEYEARAVIIATGATHRLPGLDREFDFIGNGISFCAVCDGAFYEGKTVAVLGGGNSALQEAILLSDLCKKVYVVQNLEVLTGEKKLQEQLFKKDNVEIITLAKITELLGDSELNGIKIEANGKEQTLEVDGLFVAIGLIPQNKQFENVIALDKWGYADSDEACVTKTAGIFVAGDCRKKRIRQVATACADGAVAALAACDFIDSESK
ncbi:MAG: FAD-dependent oxidoreductase [Ruminococcaceae bacterium]|nr:FAD-dependent oxidoreductase [Oscillospiraceae bacterium]